MSESKSEQYKIGVFPLLVVIAVFGWWLNSHLENIYERLDGIGSSCECETTTPTTPGAPAPDPGETGESTGETEESTGETGESR